MSLEQTGTLSQMYQTLLRELGLTEGQEPTNESFRLVYQEMVGSDSSVSTKCAKLDLDSDEYRDSKCDGFMVGGQSLRERCSDPALDSVQFIELGCGAVRNAGQALQQRCSNPDLDAVQFFELGCGAVRNAAYQGTEECNERTPAAEFFANNCSLVESESGSYQTAEVLETSAGPETRWSKITRAQWKPSGRRDPRGVFALRFFF
jgi:hypothetical protein